MTPEEKALLDEVVSKLNTLIDVYTKTHFIDKDVFTNKVYFKNDIYLPTKIAFFGGSTPQSKQAAITAPSGGATVDSQSRTAISTIITTLQTLGLTS